MTVRAAYTQQLDELSSRLDELAGLAARSLELATRALFHADRRAAEQSLDLEDLITAVEAECNERTVTFLALQSPVAGDLRHVFAAVRISTDLARMGRLALHIAASARRRSPGRVIPETPVCGDLETMAALASTMCIAVSQAVTDPTVEVIAAIRNTDTELDALNARVLGALDDPHWPLGVTVAVDVALIARFFERFGDQAVDVANRLHFFVTGERPIPIA